jgi:hypothetical protein
MDNELTLGRVHIVEWLNAGDDDTGQKLFAELQPMGTASQPKVEVDFSRIDTTRELLGLLSAFTDQYRADTLTPLLHLGTTARPSGLIEQLVQEGFLCKTDKGTYVATPSIRRRT